MTAQSPGGSIIDDLRRVRPVTPYRSEAFNSLRPVTAATRALTGELRVIAAPVGPDSHRRIAAGVGDDAAPQT